MNNVSKIWEIEQEQALIKEELIEVSFSIGKSIFPQVLWHWKAKYIELINQYNELINQYSELTNDITKVVGDKTRDNTSSG